MDRRELRHGYPSDSDDKTLAAAHSFQVRTPAVFQFAAAYFLHVATIMGRSRPFSPHPGQTWYDIIVDVTPQVGGGYAKEIP